MLLEGGLFQLLLLGFVLFIVLVFQLLFVQLEFLLLLLCEFLEFLNDLAGDFLTDDFHNLSLIDGLPADVEWQVVGVDDAADELIHPEGQHVVKLTADHDALDLEVDACLGLFLHTVFVLTAFD